MQTSFSLLKRLMWIFYLFMKIQLILYLVYLLHIWFFTWPNWGTHGQIYFLISSDTTTLPVWGGATLVASSTRDFGSPSLLFYTNRIQGFLKMITACLIIFSGRASTTTACRWRWSTITGIESITIRIQKDSSNTCTGSTAVGVLNRRSSLDLLFHFAC